MQKAVMYGAGNIGRGFIGQLFSRSGYEVFFIDINPVVIERLNKDHCYPVRVVTREGYKETQVENVCGVSGGDLELVGDTIASADIMATAVGVNILPRIAKPVALGLQKRWKAGNRKPLNIIICENMLDANFYLAKLVKQELNDEECGLFDRLVGLIEASIGRMVPVMTPEMQEGNPLRVWVEEYCRLPVDRDGFKGEIPDIVNMVPFAPFNFYIQRKLFMHNMGHATTAYLGYLRGCKYIWEASEVPAIKLAALKALRESSAAMAQEHGVPLEDLLEHADDLIYRFGNRLLGDTIDRVGKDPVRKLSENDRLIGAARLCIKQKISPVYISIGIAAAFLFAPEGDESAGRVQQFIAHAGITGALTEFCGINPSDPICGIIVDFYNSFKCGDSLENILEKAEQLKNDMRTKAWEEI